MTEKQTARLEKRRYWEEQMRRWRESGLSQLAYCRLHQISHHRMVYWRKRLSFGGTPSSLVEVSLRGLSCAEHLSDNSPLRLVIGGRYRVEVDRGFDPGVLHELLCVLEQR